MQIRSRNYGGQMVEEAKGHLSMSKYDQITLQQYSSIIIKINVATVPLIGSLNKELGTRNQLHEHR